MADDPTATATAVAPDPLADLTASTAALANVDADLAAAQASIDELLKQASFEDPATLAPPPSAAAASVASQQPQAWSPPVATQPFTLQGFDAPGGGATTAGIDLLRDVDLNVKIELGRSRMLVEDVLKLGEGSVVELDKLAGDPVDVYVNDKLVARGEVLVLNDNFCVRVNEILTGAKDEVL